MQMAFSNKKKMKSEWRNRMFCKSSFFVLTVLEVLGKTHMSVNGNNEAFIETNNNDARFLERQGGLQEFLHKDVISSKVRISPVNSDFDSDSALISSVYLKFVPPKLDFKERFLGVPHLQKVTLVNTDENKTIHMSSVSGNTVHFHSSFFQDKIIPPQGNTTFAVVFLGRTEGPVSSSLYIHTSEGTFKYQVSGASIGSPYRLKPLEGIRLPLNAAFQPLIQLHNPHHYPIQVVEVYSSGNEFNLELPGGETEGPKTLWEVPPYTTKPVIKAKFLANVQKNHTAYIRLKLNNSEEVLVVPVEVEVTSQPGLYSHHHFIDFGIGGSQDKPKSLKLYLCNSFKKTLKIQSITVMPESPVLKINFKGIKIPPGTSPIEVATLTYDWKVAFETKVTSGKILIKSKQNQYKLGIPFTATVLQGGLYINESVTKFLTTSDIYSARNLTILNQFRIPIAINNFTLLQEASNYFEIKRFKPVIIAPKQSVTVLTILPKTKKLRDVNLMSGLVLITNISDVAISLLSYNGKLTKIFPIGFEDLELLDVGLIGNKTSKLIRFGLQNNNPVPIEILSLQSHSPMISLQIMGIFSGNASEFLNLHDFSKLTYNAQLKPSRILIIQIKIQASDNEEVVLSQITVLSQFEKLIIPVRISVAQGALQTIPSQIVLDDCFPGKICTQPLKIQSTFNRPMSATFINSVPPDYRMSFISAPGGSEILPSSTNYIGDLRWEPGKNCGNHCYLGISINSSGSGLQWMQNELLSPYTSDLDATLLRDKYHRLLNLTNGFGSGYCQDLILRLETNEVKEELFMAQVKLIWPKFSNSSKLIFPLTQVTNTTVQRLKLYNPASQTVVVQIVAEWAYPLSKRLLDSFPPSFTSISKENCSKSSLKEFFISPGRFNSLEPSGKFNITLYPGESEEVSVFYSPRTAQKSCSLLFLRNNLTVIEVIELHGQASYAQLKFGNRKPGSDNPLMFEITEKHLKNCFKDKTPKKYFTPSLTVKKSFIIRNSGELPIYIHNIYINDLKCEGYGFSILNCASFDLPTNSARKIDVAFTPDFTLTKVQRTLILDTTLGVEVNFSLITTLPPIFLTACSSVLNRPTWEPLLYYSAISFMLFLLFCVLAAAFFESDRILKCALITMAGDKHSTPLDLRQIGNNILKEISLNSYKKLECYENSPEKNKNKFNSGHFSEWSSNIATDNRYYTNSHKEEKSELHSKNNNIMGENKEKENHISTVPNNFNVLQLNNLNKNKKKLSKRHSNNDATTSHNQDHTKKKEKNLTITSTNWCDVFSQRHAFSKEKIKVKLNSLVTENVKKIRNNIENKKDEKKEEKKINKIKKSFNKDLPREEEETSSTMTDSSNDAEKENLDSVRKLKPEKIKKTNRQVKMSLLDFKESSYKEEDCEEDCEKEKKNVVAKNTWEVNTKSNKYSAPETNINIWKPNIIEGQKNLDLMKHKCNKNSREKKEKLGTKKRFSEKVMMQKIAEPSTFRQHNSPCWEHRSFSEVVAKNDCPRLYSNIVSSKNQQQKSTILPKSTYSECSKTTESSASTLGPIGSKKPFSNWSPLSFNSSGHQPNFFNSKFSDPSNYLLPDPSNLDFASERNNITDDSLLINHTQLWKDQNTFTQLMHQENANFSMSSKENFLDYFWHSQKNFHQGETSAHIYDNHSWNHTSIWDSASWNANASNTNASNTNENRFSLISQNSDQHFQHFNLAENEVSGGNDFQDCNSSNLNDIEQNQRILSQNFFSQSQVNLLNGELPHNQDRENSRLMNGLQFDPFLSLSSIWSPKTQTPTQNSWTSTGNQ